MLHLFFCAQISIFKCSNLKKDRERFGFQTVIPQWEEQARKNGLLSQ